LLGLATVAFVAGEILQSRDYLQYFIKHKGDLVSVEESTLEVDLHAATYRLTLFDDHDRTVDCHLRVPSSAKAPYPVILILGGVRTGKQTLDYLGKPDAILLALDYPYRGPKRGLSYSKFLRQVPEMRQAMLDTAPAAMLALDYLWQRPDVDRGRVLLAGGSFGALFAPAVAAAEPRISAVAILFGAGDLRSLIRTHLEQPPTTRRLLAWFGNVIVSPLEPLKYIGRVAPRPVFMLSGTEDATMPVRNSRLLHEAAREPKTVRWIPTGHVNVRAEEFHRSVVEALVEWMVAIEFLSEEEAASFLKP
jgi:dienelactone hydrolase